MVSTIDTTTKKISLHADKTWFIADPHFSHESIRKFCARPFSTVEEMDEAMWDNLGVVGADETLVVIGDLTWNMKDDKDVKRLPGKHKILVKGNHDKVAIPRSRKWSRICDYLEVTALMDGKARQRMVLSHYPMASWAGARRSVHLHGHTHGAIPPMVTEFGGRMDAGVDVWDYKPIRLRQVLDKLAELRKDGFAVPGDY